MNITECIQNRRHIKEHKPVSIDHSIYDSIVSLASFSLSWKNTQITRYIPIEY